MMAMPTMTIAVDMETMSMITEPTLVVNDGVVGVTSAQQAYATGVVEVMSNVTEPTWEVFSTSTPQPESISRDRVDSSEMNLSPFIGIGLVIIGILIGVILVWRVVRGRAS